MLTAAAGVILKEPLLPSAPFQAPLAMQAEALLADQLSVALWPMTRAGLLRLMVTVGAAGGVLPPLAGATTMLVDWLALPPAPLQLRV